MDVGRFELCLNVADLGASRDFYSALGFTAVGGDFEDGWQILARGDGTRIALFQGHIGENLLNFRPDDVYAVAEALEKKGLAFESPAELESDGSVGATLRDPDGNLIYINSDV